MLIILSTQRSGSTMVCDDITGTEVMGKPSEYFIKAIHSISNASSENLKKYIFEAINLGNTSNNFSSVKIMSNQIYPIGKALNIAGLTTNEHPEESFYKYFHNAHFCRVIRRDKVAQAVSRVLAKETDIYHIADNITGMEGMLGKVSHNRDESACIYNQKAIKLEIKNILQEENYLDIFLKKYNLNAYNIYYEDVIEDRNYLYDIADDLGINTIKLKPRRLRKVSGTVAKEWIQKFKNED